MGFWKKDAIRRKLMTPAEQEDFLRAYGEAARPVLEAVLDAKVEELAARYEKGWRGIFEHMRNEHEGVPMVPRKKAAEMLGVSLSTIQRLEERGELPQPEHFGARTVRHRLEDIMSFARGKGIAVRKP
jgi:excisionase family DNA binding protein